MKKFTFILVTILLLFSCKEGNNKKLIGTWYYTAIEYNTFSKDTVNYFIEYTGNKENYMITSFYDGWLFNKGLWWYFNSINDKQINFISNDKFEVLLADSTMELLRIKEHPVYNRVIKDIKPNKLIFDLYSNFLEYSSSLNIDTLNDGTIFYTLDLPETKEKSSLELSNLVKYFFDKQIGSLPIKENEGEYSLWGQGMMNRYTWENLETKVIIECLFVRKDTTDKYNGVVLKDEDKLNVRIWQNVK